MGAGGCGNDMADTNIFIMDLPLEVDEATLKMVFSAYGTVVWHKVMTKQGAPSKTAIVEFQNAAEAAWVVENVNGKIPEGISAALTITYKTGGKAKKGGGKGGGTGGLPGGMPGLLGGGGMPGLAAAGGGGNDMMSMIMAAFQMGQANTNGGASAGAFPMMGAMMGAGQKGQGKKNKKDWNWHKSDDGNDYADAQKVWLGNIPTATTNEELKEHLAMAGGVVVMAAKMKGNSGVAVFENGMQASVAIAQLNGTTIGTNTLQVDTWAKGPKKQKV